MRFVLLFVFLLPGATGTAADQKTGTLVSHEPLLPKPGETVLVRAKLHSGTTRAILKLQLVEPGNYIRRSDLAYEKEWIDLTLHDDGANGDARAGDGTYSFLVPGTFQKHRRLVRYWILATDKEGKTNRFPKDEACPNFAWWCNGGLAEWTGSRDPGKTPPETYSGDFLQTMQPLHLIARAEDVAKSQWDGNFHKQKQQGTIIYRGLVYDHISFSNRGQGSAHISGKNKWSLKFHRNHELPIVDQDGLPFPETCDGLALNPGGSTPHLPVHRGISGLDEVLSMRAYRLAGVPSPPATWVQWRVVAQAEEVSEKDQFAGDLWGLYVAIGEMKPAMLADKKLPDGLVVSIQSGIKHTPRGMTDGEKKWESFINGVRSNPNEKWWRENLDLPSYFSFHALNRLLGNVDLRPDGNHGYYRHPEGRWFPIPWDNDMMFVPRHHQPGFIEAAGCLNHPKILIEYRNRAREILDLFAADPNPGGGQIGQLTRDLGAALTPKGFSVNWPGLDAALWNQHPRMNQKGSYFVNPIQGDHFGGTWTRTLKTNDFAGFQKYIVDFCTDSRSTKNYAPNDGDQWGYGWGYLAFEARDEKIPMRPMVNEMPGKSYHFQASVFQSPAGHKPAGLEWRVGRVGPRGQYELIEIWRKNITSGDSVEIPKTLFKEPGEYRIRGRWRDDTDRCSHWSFPVIIRIEN